MIWRITDMSEKADPREIYESVAIQDAASPAVWALEAIELTGLPGEPVP